MDKYYCVVYEYAVDSDCGVEIIKVCLSREEAREVLKEHSFDEREYAKGSSNWEIFEDSADEFDAGERGFYASEHARYFISEVDR